MLISPGNSISAYLDASLVIVINGAGDHIRGRLWLGGVERLLAVLGWHRCEGGA